MEIKPYEEDEFRWEQLTAGMLKEMLKDIPDDYQIRYDSFCGEINKRDFAVDHEEKMISING